VNEPEQKVTPLELFFDLVFVFAFTQVTGYMSEEPTWEGLGRGMLILAALWWCWGAYAWLTDAIEHDEGSARLTVFAAMGGMLLVALAVPGAFTDDALLFACAYFVVRVLHIVLFAVASDSVDILEATKRLARTAIPGPALLVVGALVDSPAREIIWVVALLIDWGGPYVFGVRGFSVSAAHFAERFSLIVIIALGESIVAVGAGVAGTELDAAVLAAALLGLVIAAALWWAYFDVVAIVAERHFTAATGHDRARMARDSYSYLHFLLIAGIVLTALGIKKVLGGVDEPLKTVPAVALFGGIALYFLGHIAFRLRNVRTLNRPRLVASVVCLAVIPLATEMDALATVAVAAAICALVIAYETTRYREARTRVRAAR
jgi:low temperature requirement protein LtrA